MAHRVVLSDLAEAALARLYVGDHLRWERVKRFLIDDPHERPGDDRVTCHELDSSRVMCTYIDHLFPRVVLYTIEPDMEGGSDGVVAVWRIAAKS